MHKRTWAWAGLIFLTGVNCVAILDGDHPYREGDTTVNGTPCTTDANCEDSNPCTTDTCSKDSLVCEYVTQADGLAPDSAQKAADCQQVQCAGGKPVQQEDPQDFFNDNNSCTTDSCSAGAPLNEVLADGTMCTQGTTAGLCKTGTCAVACVTNAECNDGNPCSDDLCNTSTATCAYTNLDGLPTPGATPIVGDCKLQICVGGIDSSINDDADVKDDGNPCTTDTCTGGVPSNSLVPERTLCAPGNVKVCDSMGACVECVVPADCVNIVETECEKRSCVNNTCQIAYEGQTTLASPVLQTAKDCSKVVCNGPNGTTKVSDDADLPDDNNLCTADACSNGAPAFMNKPQGTTCGASQVCNATGGCVGCNAPTDCMGTDDFCKVRTCINSVCGLAYTPNGVDLPTGQTSGDCKVLECDGMGNVKTSALTTDVPVDGNACTQDLCSMAGAPSNPAAPINSPCSVGANNACDGLGTCKKSQGTVCAAGNECITANCADGVCCNNNCGTACKSCNVAGNAGICSNLPAGSQDNAPANLCVGTNQCDGTGLCKKATGATCAASAECLSNFCVDTVCCSTSCSATCKSCNIAGTVGTCSNLPLGAPDNNPVGTCSGVNQCDGAGVCRKANGSICGTNSECFSGFCVDGVCCNTACATTCLGCNVTGSLGSCTNLPLYTDDTTCTMSGTCDGIGSCKFKNGEICQSNANCASNNCVSGFCMP